VKNGRGSPDANDFVEEGKKKGHRRLDYPARFRIMGEKKDSHGNYDEKIGEKISRTLEGKGQARLKVEEVKIWIFREGG